jgi:predicted DNA-binding transcriptional regulator YafY
MAARNALARIAAVLPAELGDLLDSSSMLVGPGGPAAADAVDLGAIRRAIRSERKLDITYRDGSGAVSRRTVWPFALGFFQRVRVVVAWCEMRQGFRHFRTDRIAAVSAIEARFPRRRQALLKEWREAERIPPP